MFISCSTDMDVNDNDNKETILELVDFSEY